jgi:hypothetical protein
MANYTDLLGVGAERVRTRTRGFIQWAPREATLALLEQIRTVLNEYADYLPLTCRQIFYRLVGAHGFEKTEQAYERLCETLNRARRAHIIPSAIRDSWSDSAVPLTWYDADEFLNYMRARASKLRLDRSLGQKTRLVVLCEAAGMVPQIESAVEEYGIAVYSSGGFDSTTIRHDFAHEIAESERPTEVLHIGV